MLIYSSQYSGRWNIPDANYPQGSGKNRTNPSSNDGSYFDQVWFNDQLSLTAAYTIASGITPNGIQDTGTASQLYDAAVNNRWNAIGNYLVGTIITATDGKQYYCNQANGRNSIVTNPIGDVTDVWREYPYKTVSSGVESYKKYANGDMTVELSRSIPASSSSTTVSFLVPFKAGSSPIVTTGTDNFATESVVSYQQLTTSGLTLTRSSPTTNVLGVTLIINGKWI